MAGSDCCCADLTDSCFRCVQIRLLLKIFSSSTTTSLQLSSLRLTSFHCSLNWISLKKHNKIKTWPDFSYIFIFKIHSRGQDKAPKFELWKYARVFFHLFCFCKEMWKWLQTAHYFKVKTKKSLSVGIAHLCWGIHCVMVSVSICLKSICIR